MTTIKELKRGYFLKRELLNFKELKSIYQTVINFDKITDQWRPLNIISPCDNCGKETRLFENLKKDFCKEQCQSCGNVTSLKLFLNEDKNDFRLIQYIIEECFSKV